MFASRNYTRVGVLTAWSMLAIAVPLAPSVASAASRPSLEGEFSAVVWQSSVSAEVPWTDIDDLWLDALLERLRQILDAPTPKPKTRADAVAAVVDGYAAFGLKTLTAQQREHALGDIASLRALLNRNPPTLTVAQTQELSKTIDFMEAALLTQ